MTSLGISLGARFQKNTEPKTAVFCSNCGAFVALLRPHLSSAFAVKCPSCDKRDFYTQSDLVLPSQSATTSAMSRGNMRRATGDFGSRTQREVIPQKHSRKNLFRRKAR